MATNAAYTAFRRVYANPQRPGATEAAAERLAAYALYWSYYTNSTFDDLARWEAYRSRNSLYRFIRPIYNPARRLIDFYAGAVYAGDWPDDAAKMTQIGAAIPWGERTPAGLLAAISQLYQWSNWRVTKSLMIRYAGATGDALGVIVDDLGRGKVYPAIVWPGHVAELDTNAAGDVIGYALEYQIAEDDTGVEYVYRREVDKTSIRTYRDGRPHSYNGAPEEQPNPYGFVPAAWINHQANGTAHGDPALRNIGKIDELNNLAAHALDQAHRIFEAPILVAGEHISAGAAPQKAGNTSKQASPTASREELKLITGGPGSKIETAKLDPGEALEHIDRLIAEIEADHPELTMYSKMREMSTVTGPAADRLFGDVRTLIDEARTQYDQATIKLFQMAVSIAGWRANSGSWGELDRQHAKFAGYDLDSYDAGDLDLTIQSRPLILPTREEQIALERMEANVDADRRFTEVGETPQSRIADRLRQAAAQSATAAPQQAQQAPQ